MAQCRFDLTSHVKLVTIATELLQLLFIPLQLDGEVRSSKVYPIRVSSNEANYGSVPVKLVRSVFTVLFQVSQ